MGLDPPICVIVNIFHNTKFADTVRISHISPKSPQGRTAVQQLCYAAALLCSSSALVWQKIPEPLTQGSLGRVGQERVKDNAHSDLHQWWWQQHKSILNVYKLADGESSLSKSGSVTKITNTYCDNDSAPFAISWQDFIPHLFIAFSRPQGSHWSHSHFEGENCNYPP